MGQWGESMFESDGVLDFLAEFQESKDFTLIENAISTVLESGDYIDVDDCYNVIAAAEIIAAIKGNISSEFPEDFKSIRNPKEINNELLKDLKEALQKVLLNESSELFELWEDHDSLKEYYDDLVFRLK